MDGTPSEQIVQGHVPRYDEITVTIMVTHADDGEEETARTDRDENDNKSHLKHDSSTLNPLAHAAAGNVNSIGGCAHKAVKLKQEGVDAGSKRGETSNSQVDGDELDCYRDSDARRTKMEDGGHGSRGSRGRGQAVLRDMAMVVLSLLKQSEREMLHQVKHLVKSNPHLAQQVFTADVEGWTPVHACALRGSKKVLKAMMHAGIDVNVRMGQPEGLPAYCTLLHIAANRPDRKIAEYLIHHGAIVNARDSLGRTPLYYATRAGNKDVIKLLTDLGGQISAEQEMTLDSTSGHVMTVEEGQTTTPEPKLSRFCFIPTFTDHQHEQQQPQTQQQRQADEQNDQCQHHADNQAG